MGEPIRARLGYVGYMVEEPRSAVKEVDKRSNLAWDWREVPIRDGHDIAGGAQLATHGFTCVPFKTSISEFSLDRSWTATYERELIDLIRQISGAGDVLVPEGRGPRLGSTRMSGANGTVDFIHNDFTAASVGRHIAEIDPARAADRLSKRFAIYNMWQLVSPPPQSKPIAICDATTVSGADVMPGLTHYWDELYHQNALLRYSPRHRWYYYPQLTSDEIIIWAGYDSDGTYPSLVPHAAFDNPDSKNRDDIRVNIDTRVFAFFD